MRNLLSYRGAVLAATLIACATAFAPDLTDPAELSLRTNRDVIRSQPASGDVVIVEIDAQSLNEIDRWPWPRSVHGQLVDRLNEANASMVAIDVDFSSVSNTAEDRAFADALARSHALVVLPAFHQLAGSGRTEILDSEPIPELRDNAFLAAVNIQPDSRGVVRNALLGVNTNGLPRPSMAAMLSDTPGTSNEDFTIDFAINPASIPRFSYADVIAGRVNPAAITGKIMLVGATAIEMGDRYAVPGHGVIPGVVIQALAAETLMAGGVPTQYGPELPMLLALLGALILIAPGPFWIRASGFGVCASVILVSPLILENYFQATVAIVPALVMVFAAGSTSFAVLGLRKYRRAALEDGVSGLPNKAALIRDLSLKPGLKSDATVVVGHLQSFSETAALFSNEEMGEYFRALSRRLSVATSGKIYRIDNSMIAWLCSDMGDEELSDHLDAISTMMRTPVAIGAQRVDADISLGVASRNRAADKREFVAGASAAALRAESAGHRWQRYIEGDTEDSKWHLMLLGELDEAMTNGDLWMAFQPKLDLASHTIIGAEALVRWQHPIRGSIPPDSFIPLAEKRGRLDDLTLFALDRTLDALVHWKDQGLDLGISVNVSANLLDDTRFIERFSERVAQSNIDPRHLTVEVTESAEMEDPTAAIASMQKLRDRGMRLSVDDYGTGQSTLSYLKQLPADEIKIDKCFVQNVETNTSDRILIRSTVELAHELGFEVVAEGIEDESGLSILKELGCDIGQGYFIGKPMPITELTALVDTARAEVRRQAA